MENKLIKYLDEHIKVLLSVVCLQKHIRSSGVGACLREVTAIKQATAIKQ